jgi:hypothetical protein
MTYIVNPIFIYWLQIATALSGMLQLFVVLALIATLAFTVWLVVLVGIGKQGLVNEENYPALLGKCKKWFRVSLTALIVISVAMVVVPTKETMIGMYVAKLATVENVQGAYKFGKDETRRWIDYLLGAINGTVSNTMNSVSGAATNILNSSPVQIKTDSPLKDIIHVEQKR